MEGPLKTLIVYNPIASTFPFCCNVRVKISITSKLCVFYWNTCYVDGIGLFLPLGHAYAGGGIFAFAHDYRIMREDRGWTRLTEIRLKLRPSPGLLRMIRAKIPSQKTAFDYIIGAKRFTGPEAFVGGIVHRLAKKENVINDSIDMVQEIVDGKVFDKATVRKLKIDLYGELYKEIMREFMKDDVQLLFTPK